MLVVWIVFSCKCEGILKGVSVQAEVYQQWNWCRLSRTLGVNKSMAMYMEFLIICTI